MGGWFAVALGVVASVLFYRSDNSELMWITSIVTVISFWSWGVMHNQAVEAAKSRGDYSGGFYDLADRDLRAVSDRLAFINMIAMVGIVGLLITAVVLSI